MITMMRINAITATPRNTKISGETLPPPADATGICPAGGCIGTTGGGIAGMDGGGGAAGIRGAAGIEGTAGGWGAAGICGADGIAGMPGIAGVPMGGSPIPASCPGGCPPAAGVCCDLIMRVYSLGPEGSTTGPDADGGGGVGALNSPVAPVDGGGVPTGWGAAGSNGV
jgi:hypothetical protein